MTATGTEKQQYQVESVEKIETPEGMPGKNWHRYVIRRGSGKIEGMKPGTLTSVTQHAKGVAADLNLRAGGAYSAYAARKRS